MGYGKSSGVDVMSYIYKILGNDTLKYVEESSPLNITIAQNNCWNVHDLIHKNADQLWNKRIFLTMQLESFERTKKWLENHPELLL
jgi:hypothetical protein